MKLAGATPVMVVLIALGILSGCGAGSTDYYPLVSGKTWDYEVRRSIKGELHRQRLVVTSLPSAVVDGTEYYPQRRIDDGLALFRRDETGIVRINDEDASTLAILPAELKPKSTWQTKGQILFLEVTGAFHATFQERKKQMIDLDYEIEAMDDTVSTPAGTFENCMRVRSSGSMFAGATLQEYLGIRFIQVDQTEWYAPGVGLVKRVRKESTTPAEWNNEFEQELVAVN